MIRFRSLIFENMTPFVWYNLHDKYFIIPISMYTIILYFSLRWLSIQQFCLFTECLDRKGSASGTCAAGFGVCCVFLTNSCGSTVRENCTYIRYISFGYRTQLGSWVYYPKEIIGISYDVNTNVPRVCIF